MKTKVCKNCGRELPETMFYKSGTTSDGLGSWCKECTKESAIRSRRQIAKVMEQMSKTEKVCSHCGRLLPIESFSKDITKNDGHRSWCKECINEKRKNKRRKETKEPTLFNDDREANELEFTMSYIGQNLTFSLKKNDEDIPFSKLSEKDKNRFIRNILLITNI